MKFVREAQSDGELKDEAETDFGAEVDGGSDTETVITLGEENDPTPLYEQDTEITAVIHDEGDDEDGNEPDDVPEPIPINELPFADFIFMQWTDFGPANIFHNLNEAGDEDSDDDVVSEVDGSIGNSIAEEAEVETVNEADESEADSKADSEADSEAVSEGISETESKTTGESNHETETKRDTSEFGMSTEFGTGTAASTDTKEIHDDKINDKAEAIPKTEEEYEVGIDG